MNTLGGPPTEEENPAAAMQAGGHGHDWRDWTERLAVPAVWLAIIVVFSLLKPETFFTLTNFKIIFGSQAVLVILTLALLVVLITGEFDLGFAAIFALCGQLIAVLMVNAGWALIPAVIATLLAAAFIGAIQAYLVVAIGVPSVVVTLGSLTLLPGIGQLITNNEPISGVSKGLESFVNTEVFGLPLVFFYAILACLVLWYVLQKTPLGRHLYFVGQGAEVARLAGVEVNRIRAGAFIVNALISGAAGILLTGQLNSASPEVAITYLLPAFSAAFLGATTVVPGRFNAWGTFIAVYFLVTGFTGLQMLGTSTWIQPVFYGGSLIAAVVFARLVSRRAA